jgi:hypothetical protein
MNLFRIATHQLEKTELMTIAGRNSLTTQLYG